MTTNRLVKIVDGNVFIDGVIRGTVLSQEPALPRLYDTFQYSREVWIQDASGNDVPSGTFVTCYKIWNGVGEADLDQGQEQWVTFHE